MNPFTKRLEKSQRRLAQLEKKQRQLDASVLPGSYITGRSGQSATYRKRLDRQLERTVELATALVQVRRDVARWQRQVAAYDAGLINEQGRAKPTLEPAPRQPLPADDRLFVGNYPEGIVYADRGHEVGGDYATIAFLSYRTLVLAWRAEAQRTPPELLRQVEGHAAGIQARRGEQYIISTVGQYVTLGAP